MSDAARLLKIRRIIWTGAIASVTATGAWYGAGLKIQRDVKLDVQKRRESTPAEKIEQLETQRGGLVAKRIGLEKKLREVELRAQGKTWEESREGKERKR